MEQLDKQINIKVNWKDVNGGGDARTPKAPALAHTRVARIWVQRDQGDQSTKHSENMADACGDNGELRETTEHVHRRLQRSEM